MIGRGYTPSSSGLEDCDKFALAVLIDPELKLYCLPACNSNFLSVELLNYEQMLLQSQLSLITTAVPWIQPLQLWLININKDLFILSFIFLLIVIGDNNYSSLCYDKSDSYGKCVFTYFENNILQGKCFLHGERHWTSQEAAEGHREPGSDVPRHTPGHVGRPVPVRIYSGGTYVRGIIMEYLSSWAHHFNFP